MENKIMRIKFLRAAACLLIWMVSTGFVALQAQAQLPPGLPVPPENYAASHFFGAPSAVDIEHFSLGGAGVADDSSAWQGNPAGVLAATKPEVLTYYQRTDLDKLPDFRSSFFGYAQSIGKSKRLAFKISYIPVSASGSLTGTPLEASIRERDPGTEIAYRLSQRLSVGAGFSYLSTDSDYKIPGIGVVTHLESHPRDLGGRIGFIYRASRQLSVGATLDRYSETVEQSLPAFNIPATNFKFDSKAYRVGLQWQPRSSQKVLLDYEAAQLEGATAHITQHLYHLGFEQKWKDWALRVGSYDGKFTGGLGYQRGHYKISYGFSNRYKENFVGQGAHASHAIQLNISF
jgi:hypothetical protein